MLRNENNSYAMLRVLFSSKELRNSKTLEGQYRHAHCQVGFSTVDCIGKHFKGSHVSFLGGFSLESFEVWEFLVSKISRFS